MNKHFNIKNITIIVFMFICFFTLGSNVKAAKVVCNYRIDGYEANGKYDVIVSYDNEKTNPPSLSYLIGDDTNTAAFMGTVAEMKPFSNGCPEKIYETVNYGTTSKKPNRSFYISKTEAESKKDGIYETFALANTKDYSGMETCDLYLFNSTINTNDKKLTIYKSTNDNEKPELALDGRFSDDTKKYVVNFTNADVKGCPNYVYLKYQDKDDGSGTEKYTFSLSKPSSGTYDTFKGNVEIHKKSDDSTENSNNDSCSKLGGAKKYITWVFNLLRYLVPTLIIILSTIEFIGVVLSGEDEKMEKAKKHFIIRLIVGIVIILIPFFVEFFLKIIGVSGSFNDIVCNIIK